jgi:hypothetical protein
MVHPTAEGSEARLVREAQIMRALLVFLTLCAVLTLGLWTTTQYEAQYIPAGIRGAPWATVAGSAIYQPHAWLRWYWQADYQTRLAMSGAIWIFYGTCVVAMFAAGFVMKLGAKKKMPAMGMAARSGVGWMTRDGRD